MGNPENEMAHSDHTGRVVIVTGGAGAVGGLVSRRWLEAGASVLVVDHREPTLDRWRSEFAEGIPAGHIATLATDVATAGGAKEMVDLALSSFGRPPDTLIHLVGGFAAASVESDEAESTWTRMMSMNLTSAFHCYRAVLPSMRALGGGWIVGLSSKAAKAPGARLSAYAASKAGLAALTAALSAEVRSAGIHVNLIVASTIDTEANRKSMGADRAGDWVTPGDIADATLYLCSSSAGSVHGASLEVFGLI